MPSACLRASPTERCRLADDHHRERKTGPCFALAVVRCRTHDHRFTLYPPGHVPYGRVAVAPVSADGEVVVKAADSGERAATDRAAQPGWDATVFAAADDAAAGRAWPRDGVAAGPWDGRRWRTQQRYLQTAGRLLGITAHSSRQQAHHARILDVPALELRTAQRLWSTAGGYRGRGAAIVAVLAAMPARRSLGDQLYDSGTIAGLWGRPSRWDPGGAVLWPVAY